MSKSLYNKDWRYTAEAIELDDKVHSLLKGLFNSYVEKGYNPRAISHLIMDSVRELEANAVLNKFIKTVRAENHKEVVD